MSELKYHYLKIKYVIMRKKNINKYYKRKKNQSIFLIVCHLFFKSIDGSIDKFYF